MEKHGEKTEMPWRGSGSGSWRNGKGASGGGAASGGFLDGGKSPLAVLDLKKAGDGVNAGGGRFGGRDY